MLCEVLRTTDHRNLGGASAIFYVGAVQPCLRIIAEKLDRFPLLSHLSPLTRKEKTAKMIPEKRLIPYGYLPIPLTSVQFLTRNLGR